MSLRNVSTSLVRVITADVFDADEPAVVVAVVVAAAAAPPANRSTLFDMDDHKFFIISGTASGEVFFG